MFHSSHFSFLVFLSLLRTNWENSKILGNLCLHFARQDGQQDGKNRKENHATKVTKIPKTKRRKYRMNETLNFHGADNKVIKKISLTKIEFLILL